MRYEELQPILENMPGFAYLQGRDYTIPYANSFFCERFGNYEERRCYEILYGYNEPCNPCLTAGLFESMTPREQEWEAPDGRIYLAWDTPFMDPGGVPMALRMGVDITERKQREEESRKARNLESLFIFGRGIAHDFNNILTSILGNVSLGKMISHPGDKIYGILAAAEKSSLQARDLINRFLLFAKLDRPRKKKCDVRRLLNTAAVENLAYDISCSFSLPADLWPVAVDEGQIVFAFGNLFGNACSALPRGGVMHVEAENVYVRENHPVPLIPGNYVKIVFRDEGKGIPRELIPMIFDPYVTTKELGQQKGVGLGLTMSYAVLKNHDGYITAESGPGSGAVFSVYIPAQGGVNDTVR